ncbi:MAG: hypothetical protein HKN44_04545 [Ilumatobacter sp.]|nr:hypothetical protein [Ilumatobacter sp.]
MSFDDYQANKYRISPVTGSQPTGRDAEYHGPARSRVWIVAAVAAGFVALFVVMLALNPTDNDDPPAGNPPSGAAPANL